MGDNQQTVFQFTVLPGGSATIVVDGETIGLRKAVRSSQGDCGGRCLTTFYTVESDVDVPDRVFDALVEYMPYRVWASHTRSNVCGT